MNQTIDFNEHKRKLFFEKLSAKTTKASLEEYLSGFPIEICKVPCTEPGKKNNRFFL